jgi:hypothetical protein
VDQVDSWLNAQRGWRRFGVVFVGMLPPVAGMCVSGSVWWRHTVSSAMPTTGQAAQALVASVPVTAVLAGLVVIISALAERRWHRKALGIWRGAAAVALMSLNIIFSELMSAKPLRSQPDYWVFPLQLVIFAGAAALLVWNATYNRRVSALAAAPDQTR